MDACLLDGLAFDQFLVAHINHLGEEGKLVRDPGGDRDLAKTDQRA